MRTWAVAVGGLLLVGGGALVVLADQERAAQLDEVRSHIQVVSEQLDESKGDNYRLAAQLTRLRSQVALQEEQLDDATGFLQ